MAEDRSEREARLVPTIEALIDTQKRMLASLGSVTGRFDTIETELVKLIRQGLKAQSELASFRSDITNRVDALASRMEELEHLVDRSATELKGARSEIAIQHNEILNALQAGLDNAADVKDIKNRLEELERRIGI